MRRSFFCIRGIRKFICKDALLCKKILFKDIFFSFEASQSGKELAVRSGNEHSKVNPSANLSEGRLQFGGRDIFTFPPLCPLPSPTILSSYIIYIN